MRLFFHNWLTQSQFDICSEDVRRDLKTHLISFELGIGTARCGRLVSFKNLSISIRTTCTISNNRCIFRTHLACLWGVHIKNSKGLGIINDIYSIVFLLVFLDHHVYELGRCKFYWSKLSKLFNHLMCW